MTDIRSTYLFHFLHKILYQSTYQQIMLYGRPEILLGIGETGNSEKTDNKPLQLIKFCIMFVFIQG